MFNSIHRFFCLALIFGCVYCTPSGKENNSKVVALNEQETKKQSVKAFWEVYRKAQDFKKNGEFQAAKTNYLQAIAINPTHEDALFNLGNMCYELGEFGEAEDAWNRLIVVNDHNARAHFQLGNLYLRYEVPEFFNLVKAEREFKSAAVLNRVVTGPLLHLGQIALIRNQPDSAILYFNSVTATNVKSSEAFFQLGYLNWVKGNEKGALINFQKAIEVSIPEEAMGGVLSEGDTREGKSLARPINESVFSQFLVGLNLVDVSSLTREMNLRYQNQQSFIENLKKN